jgi:hypothetical protein
MTKTLLPAFAQRQEYSVCLAQLAERGGEGDSSIGNGANLGGSAERFPKFRTKSPIFSPL